jgi:hypothetical protein
MRTGSRRGRKIVGTVLQLLSLLNDHGMTLGQAFLQARIDASGGRLFIVDNSVPAATLAALRSIHPTTTGHRAPFPFFFGCPSDVVHTTKRTNEGCPEVPNCPAAQLPIDNTGWRTVSVHRAGAPELAVRQQPSRGNAGNRCDKPPPVRQAQQARSMSVPARRA